jgi:hypothetical protein
VSNIGYTIVGAAEASGATVHDIEDAIREHKLPARRISGNPVILGVDILAWIETHPGWHD